MVYKNMITSIGLVGLLLIPLALSEQPPLKTGVHWTVDDARKYALKHIEPKIDPHQFDTFAHDEPNSDLDSQQFKKRDTTYFRGGFYAVAYHGENEVHYYHEDGTLFKVSLCSKPFGPQASYPRQCMEYSYPQGEFLTVSLDTAQQESFIFNLSGDLIHHWVGEEGYDSEGKKRWERW